MTGIAVPDYWLAILLIYVVYVWRRVLPSSVSSRWGNNSGPTSRRWFPAVAREGLAGAVSQSEPPRRENTTDGVDERHSRRTPVPRVADDRHAIRRRRWPPTWCGAILNLLRLISVGGGALPVRGPTWNRIRSTTTALALLSGAAPITPACSWRCCPPSSASKSTTLATAPR